MPRRNWKTVSTDEILERMHQAGLTDLPDKPATRQSKEIGSIDSRISAIINLTQNNMRKATNTIFLVMYDIENDKIRRMVAKYLIAQGCIRIQNSIFMADTTKERCEAIKRDLAEVQACYDNTDSIVVVPLSMTNVESMHIIGRSIDLDLIIKNRSTIFF